MTARELREKYLRFFESKGHKRLPSGPLVPYDVTGKLDESLLFNGAGMVQFKPYFRGTATPPTPRLVNSQKCVRTGDIDEVGDTSHLTFFEMLGNFSFGDYFKAEAIAYSWEFLTSPQWLALDPQRLSFTIFEEDDEAAALWDRQLRQDGIDPSTRVFRLGEDKNYWPASAYSQGPPGPCGPDTEMFYWTPNDEPPPVAPYGRNDYLRDEKLGKWLEIWNNVFIQFDWKGSLRDPTRPGEGYVKEGLDPLPFPSIDTGMGLERTVAVLSGKASVYDIDLFAPILRAIEGVGGRGKGRGNRDQGSGPSGQGPVASATESAKEDDSLDPLLRGVAEGRGVSSGGARHLRYGDDPEKDRAIRIVADHVRTACFCIAEGILPSNTGRGYVLRRLIRRAVLKGQRVLGFDQPFSHEVYEGVVEAMGHHFAELEERREVIVETLQNEEQAFRRTLDSGFENLMQSFWFDLTHRLRLLGFDPPSDRVLSVERASASVGASSVSLQESGQLSATAATVTYRIYESPADYRNSVPEDLRLEIYPGDWAFKLYDTYGFPLEVTQELCAEAGVEVDLEGYEAAMHEAQERSRGSDGMANVYAENEELVLSVSTAANAQTVFLGYETTEARAQVAQISPRFGKDGLTNGHFQLCLDQTPFYAESGGEVGDTGAIACDDFEFKVTNTWKEMGLIWHDVELVRGPAVAGISRNDILPALNAGMFFKVVEARVDAARRKAITRNHTATHLLHATLRKVLGKQVTQAGSLVAPEHLRFDFTHGKAMSAQETANVERMVNQEVLQNDEVTVFSDLPIEEAKKKGAMALFGEKYGERVRMIQVGEFSKELCGGCHVGRTGEIGLFKIVGEASAASGVRRIEAITGETAYAWVLDKEAALREAADLLKANPANVVQAVQKTLEQLRDERKGREKAEHALVQGGLSGRSASENPDVVPIGSAVLWAKRYDSVDPKIVASAIDDAVATNPALVAVAAIVNEGKVNLVCKVGPEAQKAGAHAGNLVRELAKLVGGGGGGRPDFATAGGKDPTKVDGALSAAAQLLAAMLA